MTDLIADVLLVAGCVGAAIYCFMLSRKLSRLNQFESGLGGAIAVLSAQVDDMQKVLAATEGTANEASGELKTLLSEANDVATRLDLLLAGVDDLPEMPQATFEQQPDPEADTTAVDEDDIDLVEAPIRFPARQSNEAQAAQEVAFVHRRKAGGVS